MLKENKVQNVLLILLAVAVVTMSVGFAVFVQNINVDGSATFNYAKWEIKFDKDSLQYDEDSIVDEATLDTAGTTLSYDVELDPGEKYEFDIDVKNSGTFDAVLKTITFGTNQNPTYINGTYPYVNYTFSYDGTTYGENATNLTKELAKGSSATVHVKVEYPVDYDHPENLQTSDENGVKLALTVVLGYEQKVAA